MINQEGVRKLTDAELEVLIAHWEEQVGRAVKGSAPRATFYRRELERRAKESAARLPLDKWLNEVHELVEKKPAFYYAGKLGSPNFDNGIDFLCHKKGMSPQAALDWWKRQ